MISLDDDEEIVRKVTEKWEKTNSFRFNIDSDKPVFSIDTPPPYINAIIHVGNAMDYIINDAIARLERLNGKEVLFPFGLDKNGLPIEVQVEKEYKVNILNTDREKFLNLCNELLKRYSNESKTAMIKLGISFNNFSFGDSIGDAYETDSNLFRSTTQQIFIDLWKKGYIYEDKKIVNYCPVCHTTIADSEVEYEEADTSLYRIKVLVDGTEKEIATTRPEMIPACVALVANTSDERFKGLKTAKMPITNASVPVIFDESIDKNFGTGLMMLCSYGDKHDLELIRKHGLQEKIIITEEGRIKNTSLRYDGMLIIEARKSIVEDLRSAGYLIGEEKIHSQHPICWRSKTPIEFIPEKEFYVKQKEFKEDLLSLSMKMKFYPESSRQILLDWINSIDQDWPISRTRYYGTEIPLWKCMDCGEYLFVEDGKYHQPWKEPYPNGTCPKCGSKNIVGEKRILDTWFDSSGTNMFIAGFMRNNSFFDRAYPVSVRIHGKEIVRSWTFYSLLKSYILRKEVPFKEVVVHFHVVDQKGEKMSKSKGNTVTAIDALKSIPPDAFRLWVFLSGNPLEGDIRFSQDKINEAKRIINKVKNLAKFLSQFEYAETKEIGDFDRMVMEYFNWIYNSILEDFNRYDFFSGLLRLKNFLINVFADHVVELRKSALYRGEKPPAYVLNYILKNSLILMNPLAPFTSDYLFDVLFRSDINKEKFELKEPEADHSQIIEKIIELDSSIWKYKKDHGLSLNSPIESFKLDKELVGYKDIFSDAHKVKSWSV